MLSRSNLEVELGAKERQVLQLTEDVKTLHTSLGRVRESSAEQISQLRRELEAREAALKVGRAAPQTSARADGCFCVGSRSSHGQHAGK